MKKLANILVLIGALNWGVYGLFNINVVSVILGSAWILEDVVYVLVGLSAVVLMVKGCTCGCACGKSCSTKNTPESKM